MSPSEPPRGEGAPRADWSSVSLDWIDLLIVVGLSAVVTVFFGWVGWRPRSIFVGTALAPVVIAALAYRRKVLPPAHRGPVKKRLSALGVLATALMIFGLLVGLFGVIGAWLQLSAEASPVDERDVKTLARAHAQIELTPVVGEVVSAKEALEHRDAGSFADLMAVVESGPSEESIARHEAAARQKLEAEAEERAKQRRAGGVSFALRVALLSLGMIAVGGWLDGRRPRAEA